MQSEKLITEPDRQVVQPVETGAVLDLTPKGLVAEAAGDMSDAIGAAIRLALLVCGNDKDIRYLLGCALEQVHSSLWLEESQEDAEERERAEGAHGEDNR